MAEAIVSFVVERLGDLLIQKITFLRGVRGQFERLQKELASIIGFLKTADSNHNQDQDIRVWVADVRDIAYDVDDIIDAFLLKVSFKEGESSKNVLKRWYARMPKKLFNFNNIGKEIDIIFAKIVEISDRRKRYGITSVVQKEGMISSPLSEMLLRRIYPHTNDDDTIGLDDQTKTLVVELRKEEDRLCVVSINGMGGLGKSTLAKKVYNHPNVKSHFDCYAWTSISQKLNTKAALQEILRKISILTSKDIAKMNEVELFEKLYEILQTNRYLVVLDDIWSKEDWDALKPAFPNNKGSKVMFTTRNLEVVEYADQKCFHLEQRYLTDDEAWELLCRKAFGSNVRGSSDFEECGRNMVKKCCGLPLQVIVLGGILSSKRTIDKWEVVSKHIETHTSDGVFPILFLSYNELPYNLKPLFLYLGLFPEDFLISVKKLVRMWMAESLVRDEKKGETIEEVGTRYLDELIHRSMVQIGEKSMGGKKIKTCRLHDIMRELCITIGREENFFEVINRNGDFSSSSFSCLARTNNKLRRCAIDMGKEGEQYVFPKEFTQCVRTAYFIQVEFLYFQSCIFKNFKLLKVLEFGGCLLDGNKFVRVVEKLSNLRYLCTGRYCGRIDILVKSFKNLVCLQTLDLREIPMYRSITNEIPNGIMHQLRHLYGNGINLSNLNTMRKLQTLYKAWAGPWIANLVELTNLEKLGIDKLDEETMGLLIIVINGGGFDKLRSLYLRYGDGYGGGDGFSSDLFEALSAKKRHLQKLNLFGKIKKLPCTFPSNLIKLDLKYNYLAEDPMPTLEKLQHLLFLCFHTNSYDGKKMVCSANGFPKLQHLEISVLKQLEEWTVEEGAMPCLSTCLIDYCIRLKMVPQGFKLLTMLQELKIIQMPELFEERVKEGGEDWETVKHILSITLKDGIDKEVEEKKMTDFLMDKLKRSS